MAGTRNVSLPLRGQMIRRLPTKPELAQRVPMVLTQRDEDIILSVYQLGFLTTDLIELAFSPSTDSARSSYSSRAYERLRHLWLWSYIDRVEQPVARVIGGRRPFLYTLGPRAIPLVATRLGDGTGPVHRRRLDRLNDVFLTHDLIAARFWANLKALLDTLRGVGWRWIAERELRAMRARVQDPDGRFWLPFLPDGLFCIRYPSGLVQWSLVEIDNGTLTLSRFRRKVRGFEAYLAEGLFQQRFGHDRFDVFVLTHSAARMGNLQQAARQEVGQSRWDHYLFATRAALEPKKFREDVWLDLAAEHANVLTESLNFSEGRSELATRSIP
jgi:hypothetical protein